MLRVSSFWASYIHWEKVHNFAITCISPLIHSGYTTFCQGNYIYAHVLHHFWLFYLHHHTGRSSLGIYIFCWCAKLKWSQLSEISHKCCQSLKSRRHRFFASPLGIPLPFFVRWFLLMVKEKCKKKNTTFKKQGHNLSSS